MATLDDIPSLPSSLSLSLDDLVAVYDMADRRSPKKAALSEIADLLGEETPATPLDTNSDKLLYAATPGEVVEITEEGGRIEMFLGGDASDDDRWAVLVPTIALSVVYAEGAGDSLTVGEEEFDGDTSDARFVGWFRPDAIPVQSSDAEEAFVLGAVIVDYDTPTELSVTVDKTLVLSGIQQTISTIIPVRPRSSVALSFA
jgi:hypothetical protein